MWEWFLLIPGYGVGGLFSARAWWIHAQRKAARYIKKHPTYYDLYYSRDRQTTTSVALHHLYKEPPAIIRAALIGAGWLPYGVGMGAWIAGKRIVKVQKPFWIAFFADPKAKEMKGITK